METRDSEFLYKKSPFMYYRTVRLFTAFFLNEQKVSIMALLMRPLTLIAPNHHSAGPTYQKKLFIPMYFPQDNKSKLQICKRKNSLGKIFALSSYNFATFTYYFPIFTSVVDPEIICRIRIQFTIKTRKIFSLKLTLQF